MFVEGSTVWSLSTSFWDRPRSFFQIQRSLTDLVTRSVKKAIHQDSRRRCFIFIVVLRTLHEDHKEFQSIWCLSTLATSKFRQHNEKAVASRNPSWLYPFHLLPSNSRRSVCQCPSPKKNIIYCSCLGIVLQWLSTFIEKQSSRRFVSPTEAACIFPPISQWDRPAISRSGKRRAQHVRGGERGRAVGIIRNSIAYMCTMYICLSYLIIIYCYIYMYIKLVDVCWSCRTLCQCFNLGLYAPWVIPK